MVNGVTNNTSTAPASTLNGTTKTSWQPIVQAAKETLQALLFRVISEYSEIQREQVFMVANKIDQNNQDLKALGKANADLSTVLTWLSKDGDEKSFKDATAMNDREKKMLNEAVAKVFENPNAQVPTLIGDSEKADNEMRQYLALVQSGLKSGVIKPEDQKNYQEQTVTKGQLNALTQTIKAQTDSLSNISTKLQQDLQKFNSNFQNADSLNSNLIGAFGKAQSGIISNTR